ncbi:unnamed protein product, partial [Ectocarpus sp. 12 AP-2014]
VPPWEQRQRVVRLALEHPVVLLQLLRRLAVDLSKRRKSLLYLVAVGVPLACPRIKIDTLVELHPAPALTRLIVVRRQLSPKLLLLLPGVNPSLGHALAHHFRVH